jgi:hypothetical protein
MAAPPARKTFDPVEVTERFFTAVKSLSEFDKAEVRGSMDTLLLPKDRDICFKANYLRAYTNVDSIMVLRRMSDFQAIAMIARTLLELAIDVKLINIVGDAVEKMAAFSDIEKLRTAKRIVEFKKSHPDALVDQNYEKFADSEGTRIDAIRTRMWPGTKNTDLRHWAHLNLAERAAIVGGELEELHAIYYPQLSLYVHSGLTGVVNISKEGFQALAGVTFNVIIKSYVAILTELIREYKLFSANEKIRAKMDLARTLPFTSSPEEANALADALLGR